MLEAGAEKGQASPDTFQSSAGPWDARGAGRRQTRQTVVNNVFIVTTQRRGQTSLVARIPKLLLLQKQPGLTWLGLRR